MQTFLPFADLVASARVLDDRRLGKQRVETLQILRALCLEGYGWANHPAVTMWRGYTPALVSYGVAIVDAWVERGHADTTRENIAEFVHPHPPPSPDELAERDGLPPWLGWEPLHRSHRSALIRKAPEYYAPRLPDTPDDLDYVWPDPPAPPRERGERSAWVVRGRRHRSYVALPVAADEHPWVPLDARSGRITKRQRQIERIVEGMAIGDPVVVPEEDGVLHVAEVTDDHRVVEGEHRRPVRWSGRLTRHELGFPAALQDPQDVFALYDEPGVREVLRRT